MDIEKGSLNQIPLIKLLINIYEKNLSGVLYLKLEGPEGALKILYFNRGKFYSAISNSDVDKLENILLAKKWVDEPTLKKVNEEENVTESKGKILVEKGILSLEQLSEATKEQFKNILMSVLKWEEGRFQFMEESLPDGLINLDINILNFIFNYITQHLGPDYIKNHMASFQTKLKKNPNEEKINKYNLNDKQRALLSRFNGLIPIDSILQSYPREHRDSILKIIYFFFMSELIVRDEVKPREMTISKDESAADVAGEKKEAPARDKFVFGKKSAPEGEKFKQPDLFKYGKERGKRTDRRKSKQFNYLVLFIILILVLGGLVFILLMDSGEVKVPAEPTGTQQTVTVDEPETKTIGDPDEKTVIEMKKSPERQDLPPEESVKPPVEQPDTQAEATASGQEDVTEADPEEKQEKSALGYFKEGDLLRAGEIWRDELSGSGFTHSILLELDCLKESVRNAYNRVNNKGDFFILKRELNNRTCFLVFWGRFESHEKATEALSLVNAYFWAQSHPPRVVNIHQYL